MRFKRAMTIIVPLVALLSTLFTSPAQAFGEETPFRMTHGNSIIQGKLIWYNKNVWFEGTNKVPEGGKPHFAGFTAWNVMESDRRTTHRVSGGSTHSFEGKLMAAETGGLNTVIIRYYVVEADGYVGKVNDVGCQRSGCRPPLRP